MLQLQNISRSYGKTKALDDFSYTFDRGVYGLLGPNGSGKTTLLNILSGNLRADRGKVAWDGGEVHRAPIGYAPQDCEMYPSMTAFDFLRYMAVIKACDGAETTRQIEEMLGYFALNHVKHDKISTFSGGMKRRLLLIQAFLGDPALVLLDEPIAGLDPMQRILVHRLIAVHAKDRTVLYATHILPDPGNLCGEVLFLKQGRLIHVSHAGDDLQNIYTKLFGGAHADTL